MTINYVIKINTKIRKEGIWKVAAGQGKKGEGQMGCSIVLKIGLLNT